MNMDIFSPYFDATTAASGAFIRIWNGALLTIPSTSDEKR
jgi:hypothetical protein